MLEWFKDKTIGRIRRWTSRQFIRMIGELNKERLREMANDSPKELKEYNDTATLMNNNSTALHNLYKGAKDRRRFQEAFLYFFYEFEIVLKHMIMSEMMKANGLKALEEKKGEFFLVYPLKEINKIQKIGQISELIKIFCSTYGEEGEKIRPDLEGINRERNFIIHNMLKKEMNEEKIKKSFEQFFARTNHYIKNSYSFFINTFDERPKTFLTALERLATRETQNFSDRDGSI